MLKKVNQILAGFNRWILLLLMLGAALALGVADYATGPELSFALFYLGPIMLVTWYGGRCGGLVLSVVSAVLWFFAEDTTGHVYQNDFILTVNTLFGLCFFIIVMELMLAVRRKMQILANLALTDPLTGLSNRRFFLDQLERESSRAKRYGEVFSIAYIDLDNFKHVNDTLGHEAGDRLLKKVSVVLKANIRESDVVARMGGDEFAILFPEMDEVNARFAIYKIHQKLSSAMTKQGNDVTFSMGCVTYNRPMTKLRDMVKKADELMYQVKRAGKNNIIHVSYPEMTRPEPAKVVNG